MQPSSSETSAKWVVGDGGARWLTGGPHRVVRFPAAQGRSVAPMLDAVSVRVSSTSSPCSGTTRVDRPRSYVERGGTKCDNSGELASASELKCAEALTLPNWSEREHRFVAIPTDHMSGRCVTDGPSDSAASHGSE